MTVFEKWKLDVDFKILNPNEIVCMNSRCENCIVAKHFGDDISCVEDTEIIDKWLNSEVEESEKN